MKTTPSWREAWALLSMRLIAAQLGLAAGVFACFVLWVRLPDASVLEVVGSFVVALLALAGATLGESQIILRLSGQRCTRPRLLRGALSVFAGAVVWLLWSALVAHFSAHDPLRAGYWNSQVPHWLRHVLTFEHILLWLGWAWSIIEWIGTGVIAAAVFAATASGRPLLAVIMAIRSLSFWLVLLAGTFVALLLTDALMAWLPLHGLWPEIFSLVLRLSLVAVFDAIVVCWFLATLAVCVRRADAAYLASAGTPDASQPRTVDEP